MTGRHVLAAASAALLFVSACAPEPDVETSRPASLQSGRASLFPLIEEGRHAYATYCVGCHGETGDGRGEAARFMHPKPRNFQKANFKFSSTRSGRPDHPGVPALSLGLVRTLRHDNRPRAAALLGSTVGARCLPGWSGQRLHPLRARLRLVVASGSALKGGIMMACFGLGTIPAMAAIGCGSTMLSPRARLRVYNVAAALVVLAGAITIQRAWGNYAEACCNHDLPAVASDITARAEKAHEP